MPNNRKSRRQSRQQVPATEKQRGHGAEPPQPEQTPAAALDEVHGPNTPCKEVDTLRQELAQQKSTNQDLQDQLCQLTSSFKELRAKFSEQAPSLGEGKSLEDHEGLKEDIRNLQRQLDEQKQQKSNVEKKLKKLQHQHSSCQSKQTAALQTEKDRTLSLEGQLKECKKTLQDREKELAQLQQQLQDPQQQAALEERCNKLHKLLQDTFSHLQEVNAKHQQEMEKKDGDLKLMHQQLVDLRDKTRERELALERLKGLLVHSMEQDPLETLNQESSTEPAGPQKEEDDFSSPPAPEDVSSAEPAGPQEDDFSSPPAPEDATSAEPAGPEEEQEDFSSPPAPEDVSSAEPAGPREDQDDFSSPPAPEDVSSAEPAGPQEDDFSSPPAPEDVSSAEPAGPEEEQDDFSSPPATEDVSSAEPAGPREEQDDFSSPPAPEDVSSAEPAGPQQEQEDFSSPPVPEEMSTKDDKHPPEKKKPFWKKLRHSLGLRKPQSWKKKSSQQ